MKIVIIREGKTPEYKGMNDLLEKAKAELDPGFWTRFKRNARSSAANTLAKLASKIEDTK